MAHHFDNLLNLRDVGQSINDNEDKSVLNTGLLFRSARPDDASLGDRSFLTDGLGIKTIIDLRSKTEHINQAKKRDASIKSSAAVPQSEAKVTQPLKLPSVTYHDINLNGGSFEKALIKQLSWSSFGKLIGLMALGYRNEAISILGREVMQPRGLNGLGIDTLDNSRKEICQCFEVLADNANYPVLIHCTQGKDRTGLIILLALLLLGSPAGAISKDYMKSEPELEPEKEDRLKEIRSIGLNDSFAGCPSDFVETVTAHIDSKYGGIKAYLKHIGVTAEMQRRVCHILKQAS